MTRTLKIADDVHHQLRIISVVKRESMQALTERILRLGIRREQLPGGVLWPNETGL